MSKHLWEVDHPYYCQEGNYFSSDCRVSYGSWQDFLDSDGGGDFDLNLVFRWDWEMPKDDEENVKLNPDTYYRDGELKLFFMTQRKGFNRSVSVSVCQADEPTVREWLQPRLEHLLKLWEPIAQRGEGSGT